MNQKIFDIIKIAICVSMLCVASYISIPIGFSYITLQTVVINVVAILLKPKQSVYVIGIYILLGLIGFPVFPGGTAGLIKLASPVGGYYLGFIISIFVMSIVKGKENSFKRHLLIMIFVGITIQHTCAILVMYIYNGFNLLSAFLTISFPFILTDIIKCVISAFVCKSIDLVNKKMS